MSDGTLAAAHPVLASILIVGLALAAIAWILRERRDLRQLLGGDDHTHKCQACGRTWSHDGAAVAGDAAAHRCPSCGAGPFFTREKFRA